ncbi:hypothetical protein [Armatimonas rosea]|uniref:Uncharacterized protein n=1 Tax=Armatimonas rosea TaxID=685828 RepID=A0A7W9SMQ9_ARMRO|nr:hypothetical protein [Armatimonas rosea]MBB6049195.1 hypothetical protein [Armatimonas rosea]
MLLLLLLLLTPLAHAQPPLVVSSPPDATALKLKGAFGYVHTATGKLPEPSTEPLEALIARAERGEIRLAVVQEPLKGLPKLRRLRLVGQGIADRSAVTSPSTRTLGLVTAADLTGEGRPVEIVRGGLRQMGYFGAGLEILEETKVPLLIIWGALAGLGLGLAIAALRWPKLQVAAGNALAVATAGTVALLLAGFAFPIAGPAVFVVATAVLAVISQPSKYPRALQNLLLALVLLVVLDTLFRWSLVASSPLSGYYDSGIRFYGIGNEYMGLLIGAALMSVPKKWLGWVGAGITLLLGLPMLGANAGGAMAASVAFFPPSKKSWWRVVLPFVVVVALAGLDRLQPGVAQSHIGQAAGKGPSAWGAIILRKLAMNARLTVAGPTLLALGVAGVAGWQLRKPFARLESELQGRVVQALWGAGAAIAFNDSGTIAALLLLAPVLVVCLEKSLPSPADSAAAS